MSPFDGQPNFPKTHVPADSGIDYGVQRAIIVTRFAVLDFHRALSDARRQSDEVGSVLLLHCRSSEIEYRPECRLATVGSDEGEKLI
jgi:hypothetical protein